MRVVSGKTRTINGAKRRRRAAASATSAAVSPTSERASSTGADARVEPCCLSQVRERVNNGVALAPFLDGFASESWFRTINSWFRTMGFVGCAIHGVLLMSYMCPLYRGSRLDELFLVSLAQIPKFLRDNPGGVTRPFSRSRRLRECQGQRQFVHGHAAALNPVLDLAGEFVFVGCSGISQDSGHERGDSGTLCQFNCLFKVKGNISVEVGLDCSVEPIPVRCHGR